MRATNQRDIRLSLLTIRDAVLDRYRYEGRVEVAKKNNFTYQSVYCDSRIQVLKSLQCWQYQCAEGNIPPSALYRFFERAAGILALSIAEELPAYEKAQWA